MLALSAGCLQCHSCTLISLAFDDWCLCLHYIVLANQLPPPLLPSMIQTIWSFLISWSWSFSSHSLWMLRPLTMAFCEHVTWPTEHWLIMLQAPSQNATMSLWKPMHVVKLERGKSNYWKLVRAPPASVISPIKTTIVDRGRKEKLLRCSQSLCWSSYASPYTCVSIRQH